MVVGGVNGGPGFGIPIMNPPLLMLPPLNQPIMGMGRPMSPPVMTPPIMGRLARHKRDNEPEKFAGIQRSRVAQSLPQNESKHDTEQEDIKEYQNSQVYGDVEDGETAA
ncbi:hypothetical protein CDEST_05776 [Colletotrichum destructivum]|uniref:Uncharacterized protein n=1 Tax=Colletotrichum destructivum TaxID=34406 RepID=A0AAX4IC13_9PEZI|nr:hypothetical protein CDEST_05776 [Colletotrichum destructivum]